jgi:hypothetical protein
MENNIVFIKQKSEVYFSPLYCLFSDDKSVSFILHVSFASDKQQRRREIRGVKYFQQKLCLSINTFTVHKLHIGS